MVAMLKPRLGTVSARLKTATVAETQRMGSSKWAALRERILRRDCGVCQCDDCQRTGALKAAREVDHRTPLWAGGTDDEANLSAINHGCHKAKSDCEAAMRAKGGFFASPCTCGRHLA